MKKIFTFTLSCGAALLVEPMSGVRSAALRALVPCGNATDPPDRQGLAAVTCELLLRGAGDLDSRGQADAFDRLGAARSCDNGRAHTSFGVTLLGERLAGVVPLLAATLREPRFEADSLEAASELAVQAIDSLEDDPQQRAVIGARARHFPEPMNRSGYGLAEHIEALTREEVAGEWRRLATPSGSVFAVAGAVEPEATRALFEFAFEGWSGRASEIALGAAPPRGYAHAHDDSNQVQVVAVHDAPREADDDSVLERVLSTVLSGGMASRLFVEVREKRGLCYSVNARYAGEREFGAVSAYVGTTPERAQEAMDVLIGELRRVGTPGGAITPEELGRARTGLKSALVFAGESTSGRAASMASDWVKLGRPRTLDELGAAIDGVTLEALNDYAARRSLGRMTVQTLGPAPLRPPEGV